MMNPLKSGIRHVLGEAAKTELGLVLLSFTQGKSRVTAMEGIAEEA